jgi:hypothetical protein
MSLTAMIPRGLEAARFVPVPAGEKHPRRKWQDIRLTAEQMQQHIARGENVAIRVGGDGGIVDADLDCAEAMALAPTYLPATGAIFGRRSKPGSHWLYRAAGATYTSFADPTNGEMLAELRADGRDGGAHLTLIPPSVTDEERREWQGEAVEPNEVNSLVLARRIGWLAVGCLTMRYVSEYAARRPYFDLPDVLFEFDPALGRRAYHWVGRLAPDERPPDVKPRREYSHTELRLEEIVAAIPNRCSWDEWNRVGLAIYAASGGSELGFIAFDDFSSRSPKYAPPSVLERWRNYRRSPPNRISLGSLVHLARQAGWRRSAA